MHYKKHYNYSEAKNKSLLYGYITLVIQWRHNGVYFFFKKTFDFEQPESELDQVISWVSSQGGISHILHKMEESGFRQIVESWRDKKEILIIDGDLVLSFIGSAALRPLADKCGTDIFGAANMVAKFLPLITETMQFDGGVDKRNPQKLA